MKGARRAVRICGLGGGHNAHDGSFLTFYRVAGFRTTAARWTAVLAEGTIVFVGHVGDMPI
jgi:hypothetical protein